MTVTVEPPQRETPDAGVIEEARARQRRHRGLAGAAAAAVMIAAVVLASGGGGDGGRSHRRFASSPGGAASAKASRPSSTSCLSRGRNLQGSPSKSLLSILGVLRRPATAADAIPQQLAGRGLTRDVFVRYIRRARVVAGSPYYIYPAIVGGCGVENEREGIMELATNINLGAGIIGGSGGGGGDAADIEQGRMVATGPPGSPTSTTLTMIVPDGVADVTIHFPAGRASGYSAKVSPAVTIWSKPVGNELVARIPRSNIPESERGLRMTWRAADGHILKTFNHI